MPALEEEAAAELAAPNEDALLGCGDELVAPVAAEGTSFDRLVASPLAAEEEATGGEPASECRSSEVIVVVSGSPALAAVEG